jgi:hypothetical protein
VKYNIHVIKFVLIGKEKNNKTLPVRNNWFVRDGSIEQRDTVVCASISRVFALKLA